MRLKKIQILALTCLFIMTTSPQLRADGFGYSYIDAIYSTSDTDIEGFNINSKGFDIDASVALSENVAFTIGYGNETAETAYIAGFDIDLNSFDFGFDFHAPLAATTDVVIGFSVLNSEISIPFASEDDTGNVISAGIRHRLAPNAELDIGVGRVDIFDESATGFDIALLVEIANNFHFGIGYGSSEDTTSIGFGVRAGF